MSDTHVMYNLLAFLHSVISTALLATFDTKRILIWVLNRLPVFLFSVSPLCLCAIFKTPLSSSRPQTFTVSFFSEFDSSSLCSQAVDPSRANALV